MTTPNYTGENAANKGFTQVYPGYSQPQMTPGAQSLNIFFTNIYHINTVVQNFEDQAQRLNFLSQPQTQNTHMSQLWDQNFAKNMKTGFPMQPTSKPATTPLIVSPDLFWLHQ